VKDLFILTESSGFVVKDWLTLFLDKAFVYRAT